MAAVPQEAGQKKRLAAIPVGMTLASGASVTTELEPVTERVST